MKKVKMGFISLCLLMAIVSFFSCTKENANLNSLEKIKEKAVFVLGLDDFFHHLVFEMIITISLAMTLI